MRDSDLMRCYPKELRNLALSIARELYQCRAFTCLLLLLVSLYAAGQGSKARYFKAECGTSAGYIALNADGTYLVVWREHVGVLVTRKGLWKQEGSVITFSEPSKSPYEGRETTYRGRTFLSWTSEDAPGIIIPVESTKQDLDAHSDEVPEYVFFKTTAETYREETKMAYPFRFLGADPAKKQ